ncbi:MAG: transcription-repair coupling factor [Puniceicoccaceae bacterium MED-G31]|nr:transcription-repair coupling factor [Coraliomargarita sp.]PDH29533.1 MAG: transcription-repair coupling factor [Puniceicoccaceae bacterium MED-G31]HBO57933.1 transcription-repair coupling factor [Opitutae bacterium]|tara:strand:- start:514 stop:810 length:297 start_codon:yes stop_codon:yes gene_type:complete
MLIHTVLFWLRKDLSSSEREDFKAALVSLKDIPSAAAVYVGSPSSTPARPVIDASYDFCLTVLLEDMAAHDAYQQSPLHQAFLKNKQLWERVQIYDAD